MVLKSFFNKLSTCRTSMNMKVPVEEIIITQIPSDLSKVSLLSQLLAHVDCVILRMNFKMECFSIISFDKEWTQETTRILDRHNIGYIPMENQINEVCYDSAIVLKSTPQFQYTKLGNVVQINQDEMDEMRDEFILRSVESVMEQFGQSNAKPDFMIRIRRIGENEIIDLKENLDERLNKLLADSNYTSMKEADGAMFDQRVSVPKTRFSSFNLATLLQNQQEDIANSQMVFVYEVIAFVDSIYINEVDTILKSLPNAKTMHENEFGHDRLRYYISNKKLLDGTYPLASVNLLSKLLEFKGGNIVLEKQAIDFKVPPRSVFKCNKDEDICVDIGQVEKTSYNSVIRMKPAHTLVTGATSSGKTNSCLLMIDKLVRCGVNVLILEPTKSEWKQLAGLYDFYDYLDEDQAKNYEPDHYIYVLEDPEENVAIKFNPFNVPENVSVDAHIQHVINSFVVAFGDELTSPQASTLTDVVRLMYQKYNSPSFSDMLRVIEEFEDESQESDSFDWLKEALIRKIRPFTYGSIGHCFDVNYGLTPTELLNNNFVINLNWLKDEQMKNFITSMILSSCTEWLEKNGSQSGKLTNQVVLEEAHRVFPNMSKSEQNSKNGSSVKVISELMKEIRAYDTAFMVIDQSPSALYRDAVLNTAKKFAFRVSDMMDMSVLRSSMMLTEEQAQIMPVLEPGRAFVLDSDGFEDPYVVQFHRMDYIYRDRLKEKGIINQKSLDDNVQNLMGKNISDDTLRKRADDFYKYIGIDWDVYDGSEYNTCNEQEQEEYDKDSTIDVDTILERINNEGIYKDVDNSFKRDAIIGILQNLNVVSCDDKHRCIVSMKKVFKNHMGVDEQRLRDCVGDIFERLYNYNIVWFDYDKNKIVISDDFDFSKLSNMDMDSMPSSNNKLSSESDNSEFDKNNTKSDILRGNNEEQSTLDVMDDKENVSGKKENDSANDAVSEKGNNINLGMYGLDDIDILDENYFDNDNIFWFKGVKNSETILVIHILSDMDKPAKTAKELADSFNSDNFKMIYVAASSSIKAKLDHGITQLFTELYGFESVEALTKMSTIQIED